MHRKADRQAIAHIRKLATDEHNRLLASLSRMENGIAQSGVISNVAALQAENADLRRRLTEINQHAYYEDWFKEAFGVTLRTPNTWPFTTFAQGTPWCDKVVYGMQDAEFCFAEHLIEQLDAGGVVGDIVEFGTAGGTWLQILSEIMERRVAGGGMARQIWGFDSFEGLPVPDEEKDGGIWETGMYASLYDDVVAKVGAANRPFLHLVKGWFNDTLIKEPATAISRIAYARIDVDLYSSSMDCLNYLTDRLVDGAILIFDDWQFSVSHGEVLAFREWTAKHPVFSFEFLGMNMWAHLYCRVTRKPA